MKEVLSLSYDAATQAFVVVVAATHESEHVPGTFVRQLGEPDLFERFTLAELPALRNMLDDIVQAVETRHERAGIVSAEARARHATDTEREERLAKREAELDEKHRTLDMKIAEMAARARGGAP